MAAITNMLVTGPSGIGKSTLLRRVAERLGGRCLRGFLSESVWEGPDRLGWRIDAVDGSDGGMLAHVEIESELRMGRYGVDVALFERIVLSQLTPVLPDCLYLVDEIGRISTWSSPVTAALEALLDSSAPVLAVIRDREDGASPLAEAARRRADSEVIVVALANRDRLVDELAQRSSGEAPPSGAAWPPAT